MFFFCLYFYFDNKGLKKRLIRLELELKEIVKENTIINREDLDFVEEMANKERANGLEKKRINPLKKDIISLMPKKDTKKYRTSSNNDGYKNLKVAPLTIPGLNKPIMTSIPSSNTTDVAINETLKEKNISITTSSDFDPDEFIKKDRKITPSINTELQSQNYSYLEEISKHLKDELSPHTIGLTDYEKKQEEQAIISYQELLSLKENRNNQTNYTQNFIEDLKDLRNLLD